MALWSGCVDDGDDGLAAEESPFFSHVGYVDGCAVCEDCSLVWGVGDDFGGGAGSVGVAVDVGDGEEEDDACEDGPGLPVLAFGVGEWVVVHGWPFSILSSACLLMPPARATDTLGCPDCRRRSISWLRCWVSCSWRCWFAAICLASFLRLSILDPRLRTVGRGMSGRLAAHP